MAYTYRVYLAFEVPSEPHAFSEVTDRMMQDAPESGSDLCAGCHDSAGERQDERNAS